MYELLYVIALIAAMGPSVGLLVTPWHDKLKCLLLNGEVSKIQFNLLFSSRAKEPKEKDVWKVSYTDLNQIRLQLHVGLYKVAWQTFGNHFLRNRRSHFLMYNSPSNPKYSWSRLCSSLKPGHFFHIVPTFSPMFETIWRIIKCQTYWMKYACRNTCFIKLFWNDHLELLVGEAATWTAGALDSDGRCSLCVTHFQERGEHAPPEHTQSANTQRFKR